ncbi:hypothetical protein [Bacillus badius]|uniref:hypothetical protein n=1 Tax=Bacillus badius TaxID=1455 RepID=UPI0007B3479E|nr:hypothetical protein [Bacillus badius]KZR56943.1 hypothetical protein A3781_20395 [Bacillus badius]
MNLQELKNEKRLFFKENRSLLKSFGKTSENFHQLSEEEKEENNNDFLFMLNLQAEFRLEECPRLKSLDDLSHDEIIFLLEEVINGKADKVSPDLKEWATKEKEKYEQFLEGKYTTEERKKIGYDIKDTLDLFLDMLAKAETLEQMENSNS